MKVVQINSTCGIGSTGRICVGLSRAMTAASMENHILYSCLGDGYPLGIAVSDKRYVKLQALRSRLLGNYGFNSQGATKRLIAELERIGPDIVHLHNLHSHDCDLERLFRYFRERGTKLVWTFHDCWAFTGYCPHFTMSGCDRWRTGCGRCVQRSKFSWFFDRSRELYERKRSLFHGLELTIVTPSQWMAELVGQSFLSEYPIEVIPNGIDLSGFRPVESDFRERYGLGERKLILGVCQDWSVGKGLDVFEELAKRLPEDYRIVLVGTDERLERILTIRRTRDMRELAEIYTAADLFLNPTREDTYPTVNMEALACGTPVLTFRTGGSPEIIDHTCGLAVDCEDVDGLERELLRICENRPFSRDKCRKRAMEFDQNRRFKEYLHLYERVIAGGDQTSRAGAVEQAP